MMKRFYFILVSFVTILMASCSQIDDNIDEVNNTMLAQAKESVDKSITKTLAEIEMTYEQYFKGYTLDEVAVPKDEQTPSTQPETVAETELMTLIHDSLEVLYSKTRVAPRATGGIWPFYGVFKVNTCGNYPELKFHMDCEDGGWTNINEGLTDSKLPGTWVDGNRNIWMSFCLVMTNQTDFIPYSYGALYFSGGNVSHITQNGKNIISTVTGPTSNYKGLEFIERFHDNEDSDNKNQMSIIGPNSPIPGVIYHYGINDLNSDYTPTPTHVGDKNTLLTWVLNYGFPIKQFNPGFSYGLLSTKAAGSEIAINIDDENKKSTNYAKLVMWKDNGYNRNLDWNGKFNDLGLTENTVYYVKLFK